MQINQINNLILILTKLIAINKIFLTIVDNQKLFGMIIKMNKFLIKTVNKAYNRDILEIVLTNNQIDRNKNLKVLH